CGIPAGSATASTATGSGGAIAAPIKIAPASPIPGSQKYAAAPTPAVVMTTKTTDSNKMVRHGSRITLHEGRRPNAHTSGGKKIRRINSEGTVKVENPGMNTTAVVRSVSKAGQGKPVLLPNATAKTVAAKSPVKTIKISMRWSPLSIGSPRKWLVCSFLLGKV